MTAYQVIIAGFDPTASVRRLIARLESAWIEDHPASFEIRDASSLSPTGLQHTDAAVLVIESEEESERAECLIDLLEETPAAVLVLTTSSVSAIRKFQHAGLAVSSIDCDDQRLASMLLGLLFRQNEIRQLHRDLSLAQRFHGGLRGEIARMHEELQLAAMVQREFLPRELPNLMGVEFGALWRPANYVSGDIYDILRLDDDHVGFFIADAVGHGVPAALMTMVICRSLLMKEIQGHHYRLLEPAEVLANLNADMIRRQGRTTRFATAAYGVVNCRSRAMRFAGAGHPPPILIHADGSARELETLGGLLGVFPDETYEQIDVTLAVGDRLLLYSDGFEQAFPEPTNDSYEQRLPTTRYRETFDRLAHDATPESFITELGRALDDQQGSLHQVDDLTMICMLAGPLTPNDAIAEPEVTSNQSN